MRVEVEKTRRAHEIGKDCGLFYVPEVLDFDEKTGTAVFERLNLRTVSAKGGAVKWGPQKRLLADVLGKSLAIIHKELSLPEEMCVELPDAFACEHDKVFLHGDVSVNNVCVGPKWPPIFMLDWQMTSAFGGRATYGTRYFDLLYFVSNLLFRPYSRFIYSDPVTPVARTLIVAYFTEANIPYSKEKLIPYAAQFFAAQVPRHRREKRRRSKGRALLLFPFCRALMSEVLLSFSQIELDI